MDNHAKAILRKKLKRLHNRKVLTGKRIVIYGAAFVSKEIKKALCEIGYDTTDIIDNDPRKTGKPCLGMIVRSPQVVLTPFDDNTAIFVYSVGFYREICLQLERFGYRRGKQIHVLNFKADDSFGFFIYNTLLRLRGIFWYRRLLFGKKTNTKMFIAPYTGTGDIYLAGLFFNEYLRRNNITDYVFVVVSNACKKVAEMFGIRNIKVVKPQISDDVFALEKALNIDLNITVLNDGWSADPKQWIRGYKGLDFQRVFRYFVFGFDDSVPFELPPRKDNIAAVDALFEKYELVKGKTVVLSPYSNTLFELSDDFWQGITDSLKSSGYVVCTNCASKDEKPVKGTTEVFFPFDAAVDFLDAAGWFIGIRSGLCDIISSSTAKKIVLYEKDGWFYKCSPFDYFSLLKMGLCDDSVEIEYREDLRKEIIRKILNEF